MSLAALVATLQAAHADRAEGRDTAIAQLDRWLARGYEPPQPAREEARLIIAGRWMLNGRPDHPVVAVWAARSLPVLRELDNDPTAVLLAGFKFEHLVRAGDLGEAGRLVAEVRDRTASNPNARLAWLPSAALYLWLSGRPDAALAALEPAINEEMAPELQYALLEQAASAALAKSDTEGCLAFLDRARPLEDSVSAQDRAHHWFLRAGAAAVSGDSSRASEAMGRCEHYARDVDVHFFQALWRLGGQVVRLKSGQARRAERELSDLLGDVVVMRARYLEWSVRLARAVARMALQRYHSAEADLAAALRIAAESGYVNCDPWGVTPRIRGILQYASERGIQARYARLILVQHPA
ncbi:MAG: hypothetical protein WBA53_12665 [Burkholderiaceae bacterium]